MYYKFYECFNVCVLFAISSHTRIGLSWLKIQRVLNVFLSSQCYVYASTQYARSCSLLNLIYTNTPRFDEPCHAILVHVNLPIVHICVHVYDTSRQLLSYVS
jgi:hypothetical protein